MKETMRKMSSGIRKTFEGELSTKLEGGYRFGQHHKHHRR